MISLNLVSIQEKLLISGFFTLQPAEVLFQILLKFLINTYLKLPKGCVSY